MAVQHNSISTEVRVALSVIIPVAIIGIVVISEHRFRRRSGKSRKKRSSIGLRNWIRAYKQARMAKSAGKRGSTTEHKRQECSSYGESDATSHSKYQSDSLDPPGPLIADKLFGTGNDRRINALLILNAPAPPRPDPVLGITTPKAIANRNITPACTTDDRAGAPSDLLPEPPGYARHDDNVLRDNSRANTAGSLEASMEDGGSLTGDAGELVDTDSDEMALREAGHTDKDYSAKPDADTAISIDTNGSVSTAKDESDGVTPVQFCRGGGCDILVLGPLEFIWFPKNVTRRVVSELACFLALHQERNMTGEEIRAALWPGDFGMAQGSAKSLRNAVSLLRKVIGNDMVPEASRGSGYSISGKIKTDWTRFCELREHSVKEGVDEIQELSEALSLVRGAPFEGVESGYNWAWSELIVSQMEVAIIAVARRLSSLAMANNNYELASWASITGLSASPFDRSLWQDALTAAAGYGTREIDRRWRDAVAVLGSDASDLSAFVESLKAEYANGRTG